MSARSYRRRRHPDPEPLRYHYLEAAQASLRESEERLFRELLDISFTTLVDPTQQPQQPDGPRCRHPERCEGLSHCREEHACDD